MEPGAGWWVCVRGKGDCGGKGGKRGGSRDIFLACFLGVLSTGTSPHLSSCRASFHGRLRLHVWGLSFLSGWESGLRLLSLHPAPRLMCSPSAVTGLPAGDRAWNLSGTLWNSVSFHHVNALFIRETVRVTNLCLFLFFILNISG